MTASFIDFTTVSETENPLKLPDGWPSQSRAIYDENEPESFLINHRLAWSDYLDYLAKMQKDYDSRAAELTSAENASAMKAERAAQMLANPEIKALIDYMHAEIKCAAPDYVIPDVGQVELDLADKIEGKP